MTFRDLTEEEAALWDGIEIVRVSGEMACEECGELYRKHPRDHEHLSYDGKPFLRIGCDGRRLKL